MFSFHTRVRYQETDKGGRVYHANYLIWLDMTRTEFLRQGGVEYAQIEQQGFFLLIKKANIEYFGSAIFDDEIEIVMKSVARNKIRLDFHYDILHNLSRKLLVEAYTQLVCVDKDGKPIKIPEKINSVINKFNNKEINK